MVRKTLSDFGYFPEYGMSLEPLESLAPGAGDNGSHSAEEAKREVQNNVVSFNIDQRRIFDEMVGSVLPGVLAVTLQGEAGPS